MLPTEKSTETKLLRQTLWVWFLAMLGIRILHELQRLPSISDYTVVFTAAILIYVPLGILWKRHERIAFFDQSWRQLSLSLFWFGAASVVIFPILELGNRFYQEAFFGLRYVGGNYSGLGKLAFFQLALIAIPEELFYRGYLQFQLDRVWGRPWKILGAPVGKSLLVTSLLFAFSHSLISLQWWHFSIFFPALVFGWLREKTGSITASVLFHACSNIYTYWIALNYRP